MLDQRRHWDSATREIVLERTAPPPARAFFTSEEEAVCRKLMDRLLAREPGSPIPVVEMIDKRLAAGSTDGWRYDDMPPDAEAWRRSLAELGRTSFPRVAEDAQNEFLESIRTSNRFAAMPAPRLWGLWMRYACAAFYSHPSAWSEIGFGGPAYPRGYKNMGLGRREPWEIEEVDARDPIPWAKRIEAARRGSPSRKRTG